MMVESTIVPFLRISPFAISILTTCVNSFSCSPLAISSIGEVIEILQKINPEHQFQIVGLVSALSFVIVRPD